MLSLYTYDISTIFLILILSLAVLMDWRRHRLPNWLTIGALVVGVVLHYLFLPAPEWLAGLKGAGMGLIVLLPFFLLGGMGAGDVKLMAAVGSFMGPAAAFLSVSFALVLGGVVAVFMIIRSGEAVHIYRRYVVMISAKILLPAEPGSVARRRFPFALSIAFGTLIQLGLNGKLEFYHLTTQIQYQLQALGVMQ